MGSLRSSVTNVLARFQWSQYADVQIQTVPETILSEGVPGFILSCSVLSHCFVPSSYSRSRRYLLLFRENIDDHTTAVPFCLSEYNAWIHSAKINNVVSFQNISVQEPFLETNDRSHRTALGSP
jgi:hypothetical protein